ncbi:MAG: hypothetical protein CL785_05465 [Chloroflexi bacterium]|nr:hypothetical protein [Chloroflexota bacterium]|tara:strand:+ start:431 stop:652 length:222 start_codon:yes stop_codon:yes gene_type:complete
MDQFEQLPRCSRIFQIENCEKYFANPPGSAKWTMAKEVGCSIRSFERYLEGFKELEKQRLETQLGQAQLRRAR